MGRKKQEKKRYRVRWEKFPPHLFAAFLCRLFRFPRHLRNVESGGKEGRSSQGNACQASGPWVVVRKICGWLSGFPPTDTLTYERNLWQHHCNGISQWDLINKQRNRLIYQNLDWNGRSILHTMESIFHQARWLANDHVQAIKESSILHVSSA